MLKSMTAYGRADIETELGRFSVEIQCVNRKFLEIQTFLPKELWRFDTLIRQWVSTKIHRGQVNVRVTLSYDDKPPVAIRANLPLARQYKQAFDEIVKDLGYEEDVPLQLIAKQNDVLQMSDNTENEEEYESALNGGVNLALEEVMEMKEREGQALQRDIEGRLGTMKEHLLEIEKRVPEVKEKYYKKIAQTLEEILPESTHEERLLREVCLFAERADIAEEVTRFHSHLDQCEGVIKAERPTSGKTLEFLVQEMQREANTMGSKSADVGISSTVVEIKGEMERIREQIQNVE